MKIIRKGICILTLILLLISNSSSIQAAGIVNSAYSSTNNPYISTSHYEHRLHTSISYQTQTDYVWKAVDRGDHGDESGGGSNGSTAGYVPSNTGDTGYSGDGAGGDTNYQPSRVQVPVVTIVPVIIYYYSWDYIYSGFYPNISHGPATITKSPYYVFTKWHQKVDGSNANMDIQISIPGVYIDGYTANISHWSTYHSLERYNGAGWYSVTPVTTVSGGRDGNYSYHVKYEYPYAGTTNSILYFNFKASVVEPHTYTLDQQTGTTQTINSYVNIPITVSVKIPVNGFNSTDLREPSSPTSDLGFVGSQNSYSVQY